MKNIFILITFLLFFSTLNAKDNEKVSIQLKWKHSFQFAGYYAAIEKGFYKDEGLEVTLKEIDFQKKPVQSVIDEESQYGISDSTLVVYSLQGSPIVLISQIFQQSPLVLISLYESKITTPYDMIGKKISYSFDGYGGIPINAMFLNSIGGLSDIKLLPFASYEDLINKKVDVISAYSTSQPFIFAKKGIDINIIDPKSYGIDFYGDNFFTTKKELNNHPDRVFKMRKATLKGWEYALKNQDEIIDIIIKKYAPKADKELLRLEAKSTSQMIKPNFIKLGNINKYKYLNVAQTYHKLGLVKKSKIDDKFFYEQKSILTKEQTNWIKETPIVVVGAGPDWAPFDFVNSKGEYNGISKDYLDLIAKKTGLKFDIIVDKWSNNLKKIRAGKIDLLHAIYYTKQRSAYMNFTLPYFEMLDYFFIRDDLDVKTIKDLNGKRVAIPKGYAHEDILKKEFPLIKVVTVDTFSDAIDAVLENRADILFDTYVSLSYVFKNEGISTIVPFKSYRKHGMMKLHMATDKNNTILTSIIQKGLDAITDAEKKEIYAKWISKNLEDMPEQISLTQAEKRWLEKDPDMLPFEATSVDRTILYQMLGVFGFILLLAGAWNYKLSSEIKKREKLNEALKESEAQIKTLIDNILIYVIVTTMDGKMLLANPKTIKDYNLSNEDIGNYNILEYYASSSQRDEVLNTLQKEGVVKEKIIKLRNYAKGIDNIMASILPIMYNHQNALLTIGVDLTQRMKMEEELSEAKKQAELANLSKSEFLANMSHEIRTPMNSVIGFSNLLDKLITDPIQKDYLSSIKRGGSALLDIINDILDLSKIEAGKLEIVLESVNIKKLSQEMESIFSVKFMQKNLNFELEIDDSIPKYLLLDSARIRQILFNILGNAIKFTDNGTIKLTVKKIFDDEKKSKVDLALIIEDSGIGIDAKNIETIFNSFEQQKGQSQKYGGTGLGLAICKKLLNFMNGSIKVESELGKGSKFTIYLRDVSVSSIGSEQKKPQLEAKNIKFNSASILVVDDIKDNRKLIKSSLKDYGLNIYEAQNGKDALEKLKSIKVDLICMDIKMPIMDGYEAVQIIKNNPLLKNIPVIAITASVMGKDMQKIKEYKFDGYLRKPVSCDELILTLTKFLTYNTFKVKADKNDSSKKESYVDLPKTVKILEEIHIASWNKMKDLGDFSLIEEFAMELIDLAQTHPNTLLLTYAKELKINCESFDIERVDFMLNSFPNLIEKLKNILKKEEA